MEPQGWPACSEAERAMAAELMAREALPRERLVESLAAIADGSVVGPLHRALYDRGLITAELYDNLQGFVRLERVVGRYHIQRRIGSGAMGEVLLAEDPEADGRRVAIKVLNQRYAGDAAFVKRFIREATALAGITHPHIAAALDHGIHEDHRYLVMEYVSGVSLAQVLDERGPLPERYVLRVMIQAAEGLDHVYRQTRLVHRDLKPDNILVVAPEDSDDDLFDRQDTCRVIDFGLARDFSDEADRLTMTGVTMGTPQYMSPEQIRGSQQLDCRSDIYGLGATMYHLLTGQPPYPGNAPGAVMTAHLTEPIPDPHAIAPGLSARTRALIRLTLAKSVDQRHQNYDAFIADCRETLASLEAAGGSAPRLLRKPMVRTTAARAKLRPDPVPIAGAITRPAQLQEDQAKLTMPPPVAPRPRGATGLRRAIEAGDPTLGMRPWLLLAIALFILVGLLAWRWLA